VVINNKDHGNAYGATLPKKSQFIIANGMNVKLFD